MHEETERTDLMEDHAECELRYRYNILLEIIEAISITEDNNHWVELYLIEEENQLSSRTCYNSFR